MSHGVGIASNPPQVPFSMLCVSDIERLAKAGVKIDLGTVIPQVDPYGQFAPPAMTQPKMEDAIWDRWMQTKRALQTGNGGYGYGDLELSQIRPFQLLATQHGDKVFVSVHPTHFKYEPFMLEDDAVIFPSDALLAKIALWEKDHK
jgi:hypothetical protein